MYDDKYTNPKLETNNIEEEHAYLNAYKEIISKTADLLKYIKMDNPFEEISASNPFEGISAISKDFDHIILNLFMQSKSKNSKINKKFLSDKCYKAIKSYATNIELFKDFHTEITPQIDTVCKTLRR